MKKKIIYCLVLILFGAAAVWLYLYTTPNGSGLTNDSADYIGGARSILSGTGYSRFSEDRKPRPITHFPPGYSLILAGVSVIAHEDPLRAAWQINLICFLLNLFLFMDLIKKISHSDLIAAAAAVWYLCCGPILQSHVYGLSEAVFMVFFQLILIETLRSAALGKNSFRWVEIGLLIGFLTMIRYSGLAVLITVAIFIVCIFSGKMRGSVFLRLMVGFIPPIGVWLIRNAHLHANAVNRTLSLHFPASDKIHEGFMNVFSFLLPEYGGFVEKLLPIWIILGTLVLMGSIFWLFQNFRRGIKKIGIKFPALFLIVLQGVIYLLSIIFTVTFIDGSTLFDNRILLPFYYCICASLLTVAGLLLKSEKKFLRYASSVLLILFAAFLFEDETDLIKTFHQDGQGFASRTWMDSELRKGAAGLPSDAELFCNRQTFLWLINDQPAYILPPMYDAVDGQEWKTFENDKAWMQKDIQNGKAFAIIFNYQEMMKDTGDQNWLNQLFEGMPVYAEYQDGIIFGLK